MIGKKGFITALAIVAALAIPTVGMAGNGPLSADSQPLVAPDETETDEPYGWMDEMHDSMWSGGQLPEGSPAGPCPMGAASWGGR